MSQLFSKDKMPFDEIFSIVFSLVALRKFLRFDLKYFVK